MNLLLSPYKLSSDLLCIESLHITKDKKGISIDNVEPDASELRKHFADLPKTGRDALIFFTKQEILEARQAIKQIAARSTAADDIDMTRSALLRKAHEKILQLKPFLGLVKWHHKTKQDNGNFKTGPCQFSSFRPLLRFRVIKKETGLDVECFIDIGNGSFPIAEFLRSAFLLESRGEYFLLTWKDYQTLEWLSTQKLPAEPQQFRSAVLARLQDDYTVDGREVLNATNIDVLPQPRVMLSEISQSFLVLTPQWSYDGFIQDGPWKEETEIPTQGELFLLRRNKEAEDQLRIQLESLHPNFSRQLNGYYYLSFADAQKKQWFAKAYHKLLDSGIDVIGMDMLQHFRYSSEKITTTLEILEQSEQGFLVSLHVCFGKEEMPLADLQKMLWAGQKAVLLKDGSLGLITDEWLQRYGPLVKHGRIEKKQLRVGRWMALDGLLDGDQPYLQKEWWTKWKTWAQPDSAPIYPIPQSIQVEQLRPYQQKGYDWLRLLAEAGVGACLADDMGLGKTMQTICLLASRMEQYPDGRWLVVCPSSLMYNWQQELQRFAPSLPVLVHHGANRDTSLLTKETGQVIITSYGTMRSDLEHFIPLAFDCIVADESHTIKNSSSLTAKAITELNARYRVALSGTPVMNNTFDLYGQFAFLVPGMFGSREFFKREYANPIDRDGDADKIKALQKLTAPFLLRRTKEQVAPELPEKTESILWCEMDSDQRMAYESIRENVRSNLFVEIGERGLAAGKLNVLQGIMKLRQVCNSCELVKDEDVFAYESVKTKVLLEELRNITISSKALVFSQFTGMLDLLSRDLQAAQLPFFRLDGSTAADMRQQLVNQFNNDEDAARIFLLSLKAGNAGLNLTAADYVFLFDPWWNKAVEQQAIDRTHRIGQTKKVFAYRMLCRNSIEEKILHLQQRKAKLTEELVGGDDGAFVQGLTEEDIAYLFS
jgi:superfamily II DNA or RNA helicase